MDVEITVDLFHVSFGIVNQLRKDLTCHWGQQNHSYSPIWASETVCQSLRWLVSYWMVL